MIQTKTDSEFDRAQAAASFVQAKTGVCPEIGLVLGSGLGAFADDLEDAVRIPFGSIPHYPEAGAGGHAGVLVIGKSGGTALAVMQGRVHLYEGHPAGAVAFPMRVFGRMGIRAVILTNAAGGISESLKPGSLVVLRDHINLQGANPLIGPNDDRFGPRFVDMTSAYREDYRRMALDEGKRLGVDISQGIYAALTGPVYETPAEIRYLRSIGADVVGMSTVAEVVAARHMGIDVLAISCVTNMAAGITGETISHEEVLKTGGRVQSQFGALLQAVIPRIAGELAKR